jgi:hypothetical protein
VAAVAGGDGDGALYHRGREEHVRRMAKWLKDGQGWCSPGRRSRQGTYFGIPVRWQRSGQLEQTRGKGAEVGALDVLLTRKKVARGGRWDFSPAVADAF